MANGIFKQPFYYEVATNTDITSLASEGLVIHVKNTDSSSHTITYNTSDTYSLSAGGTAIFSYINSAWNLVSVPTVQSDFLYCDYQEISSDTDITSGTSEGSLLYIKNTDASAHTLTYNTSDTASIPAGYTAHLFYINSAWAFIGIFDVDGNNVINNNLTVNGTLTATITPSIGDIYKRMPFTEAPGTKYSGTTWVNISARAWGYNLSVSGWVARLDVHDLSESDYAATDTVSGGTYDGETVDEVFTFAGLFEQIEGTYGTGMAAKAFETGADPDVMQEITGTVNVWQYSTLSPVPDGVFSDSFANTKPRPTASTDNTGLTIDFKSSNSTSPNTAKTNDYWTKPASFTVQYYYRSA